MKLENQLTDRETSKKMQDAGIKIDTAYVWFRCTNGDWILKLKEKINCSFIKIKKQRGSIIPAYSDTEMLDWLPGSIFKNGQTYFLKVSKDDNLENSYCVDYSNNKDTNVYLFGEIFNKALSQLCLWVKENGYK